MEEFDFIGFVWRLLFAMALVLLTFNPTGHSYYHWLADGFPSVQPPEAVAGILLLIGWVFFVRVRGAGFKLVQVLGTCTNLNPAPPGYCTSLSSFALRSVYGG